MFPFENRLLVLLVWLVAALVVLSLVFVASAAMLRWQNERVRRLWERREERWERPLLDALEGVLPVEELLDMVDSDEQLAFLHFLVRYARRVRGEELEILRRAAVPGLPLLVPRAFHDTLGVRLRAVQTLGTLGLPRYESVVVEALSDESPVVAMIAARTLADPAYSHRVREVLLNIDRLQGWDRRFLAALLADFGEGGAPALRTVFVDEDAPSWVRAVAGDALGRIPDPSSGGLAVDVLERDGVNREVVITGLRLLGVVGASEHVGPVRRLARDEDDVVRAVALSALGSLGDHSDIPLLEHSVRDPSPWVALNAARALSQMGQGDVVTEIAATERPGADIARQVLSEEEEKVGET